MAGIKLKPLHSSSAGNVYIIYGRKSEPLLLDCGLPVNKLKRELWAQGFSMGQMAGCLVTHLHGDHAKAAPALMAAGVDVYCTADTAKGLGLVGHRLQVIEPREPFKINGWDIMAFEAVHNCPGAVNFLIQGEGDKLVYITDTAYCKYSFKGLTHIIIECNYALDILEARHAAGLIEGPMVKRIIDSHMGLDAVKGFLEANDLRLVQAIYLAHLSNANSSEMIFKRDIMELTGKPVYIVKS